MLVAPQCGVSRRQGSIRHGEQEVVSHRALGCGLVFIRTRLAKEGTEVRKKDVKVGRYYAIKHYDTHPRMLTVIRIEGESIYGGWNAIKLRTKRQIRIKSAAKLRAEVVLNPDWEKDNTVRPKWTTVEKRAEKLAQETLNV
jgi:hypothetical protein